jgi:[ribosomal protein S5]-alanine N-acetyltransferase
MILRGKADIAIRNITEGDKTRLAELCNNRKIWDNLRDTIPFPYTEKDAEIFIQICKTQEPVTNFAIEYKGEFAGVIGLVIQDDVYRLSAEAGYWIGEPFWGKGIATEALTLLVNYAFGKLDLMRVYSNVFEYNKASCRVLEKVGFKLEGNFIKSVFKNGMLHNELRYGLVNEQKRKK